MENSRSLSSIPVPNGIKNSQQKIGSKRMRSARIREEKDIFTGSIPLPEQGMKILVSCTDVAGIGSVMEVIASICEHVSTTGANGSL